MKAVLGEEFQFPPNGKVRVNYNESQEELTQVKEFQFPPNGKVRVNGVREFRTATPATVSIPSKREGTCELARLRQGLLDGTICVSIPSKREGTCELRNDTREQLIMRTMFQFPPNGKVRVNTPITMRQQLLPRITVSIPSKREGTCERY